MQGLDRHHRAPGSELESASALGRSVAAHCQCCLWPAVPAPEDRFHLYPEISLPPSACGPRVKLSVACEPKQKILGRRFLTSHPDIRQSMHHLVGRFALVRDTNASIGFS
jgi:hypothetical protein